MKGITINSIAKVCNGTIFCGNKSILETEASCVVIDSREIKPGGIFVAAKGDRVDGHNFIKNVYEAGALAVVCETLPEDENIPAILVEHSYKALSQIAALYRAELNIPVVGITGSVGKTTTKEFIAACLSAGYRVTATKGNFNNEIGMPLTILSANEDTQVLVLEMGINHWGEMDRLTRVSRPDIMVITNIGDCHLEYLGSREGVLRAKTECMANIKDGGFLLLNGDDPLLAGIGSERLQVIFFGKNRDFSGEIIQDMGLEGIKVRLNCGEGELCLTIPIPGKHNLYNALAAFGVGRALGMDMDAIKTGIQSARTLAGRSNIIKGNGIVVIDDCYNASPASMKASLELLETADSRKVAILGDMLELGEDSERLHCDIGEYIRGLDIDVLVAAGALGKSIYEGAQGVNGPECYYFEDKESLLKHIGHIVREGDSILVKASHGMGYSSVVKLLTESGGNKDA